MSALLEIKDYHLDIESFDGKLHVLKNINMSITAGETVGIVGESGSGKTLLVRSIMGLMPAQARITQGQIHFQGQELTTLDEKGWRKIRGARISMIFQDPMTYLNPLFSIFQQIGDVIKAFHRETGRDKPSSRALHARATELLEQVGIANPHRVLDQYPHQLSGGMRQRVLIAMALAGEAELLIADEPTTALDVTIQAQVLDLINEIVSKLNLTVIMISHDIGAIAHVAKRVMVMYQGEIVEEGMIDDILHKAKHDYTKKLLAAVLPLDKVEKAPSPVLSVITQPEKNTLIEVEGLEKIFHLKGAQEFKAVDDVSFTVAQGETFGIVGESGSGKSTIARLILRLLEPSNGKILVEGQDIAKLAPKHLRQQRKHMQLVFQNPHSALNGRHNILDAIAEPLRIQTKMSPRERERRVEELLDIVQLPRLFKYRYPHELSGGQKQRICIARAVALNPKLLVLDEPTSALDVSVQAQIIDFLNELRQELNLTYIFISHDLAVIRHICDRVMVMQRGRIVEQGLIEAIFDNPQQLYVKQLIDSARATSIS